MTLMTARTQKFTGLVFLTLLVGCSSKIPEPTFDTSELLPTVICNIEMGGDVVTDAIVALHSKDGSKQEISGVFDADSDKYQFITKDGKSKQGGVPEGTYKVTVKPGPRTKAKIPAKYADPNTSDLSVDIEAGDNTLELELIP
jgi:hypothetical protein